MKHMLLMLSALPFLAACHVEESFYEPPISGVQIEHHHRHRFADDAYVRRGRVHRHRDESRVIIRNPSSQPRVQVESPRNKHGHASQQGAEIKVPARRSVRPVTPKNTHGHSSARAEVEEDMQKNVHGHD
ncbi:hypothetical protein [Legionella israelensis]|uniref:Secreted protein n=1 Tax=Legionella israelensis TaxID=454 RepID=A0A0W0WI90_9GAMM|nr:hypothetical protein [Legionella israelensis]KTD32047.1 hypothetical protein Lisr_0520 [Legionella israelensis]QBS09090.1 hypothetical protein E4T55_04005 [Legionella israelensis]SCY08968.1 hypothetical protein SAMN02746069_01250 [Legionella israelensis DSM 19235]STX58809.1 Uncharacterised protein [Legionella israelensis]